VGGGSRIGARARLERALVWEKVEIGADVQLSDVIVTDGARLPAGSRHRNEILMADRGGGLRRYPLELRGGPN